MPPAHGRACQTPNTTCAGHHAHMTHTVLATAAVAERSEPVAVDRTLMRYRIARLPSGTRTAVGAAAHVVETAFPSWTLDAVRSTRLGVVGNTVATTKMSGRRTHAGSGRAIATLARIGAIDAAGRACDCRAGVGGLRSRGAVLRSRVAGLRAGGPACGDRCGWSAAARGGLSTNSGIVVVESKDDSAVQLSKQQAAQRDCTKKGVHAAIVASNAAAAQPRDRWAV